MSVSTAGKGNGGDGVLVQERAASIVSNVKYRGFGLITAELTMTMDDFTALRGGSDLAADKLVDETVSSIRKHLQEKGVIES